MLFGKTCGIIDFMISTVWSTVNFFARRLKTGARLPVPVISVGNILAGGVGKTEVVSSVAAKLQKQGKKVFILMRGYGSEWEDKEGFSTSFEDALQKKFPDEALLLLKKNPNIAVGVGKNRKRVFEKFNPSFHSDIVVLDDGLQHFSLARDTDIVVHDFSVRRKIYRDFFSTLKKAKYCISMSVVPNEVVQKYPMLQWTRATYEVSGFYSSKNKNQKKEMPKEALLFCGIGNPERFLNQSKTSGVCVREFRFFSDHHNYTATDVESLKSWHQEWKNKVPEIVLLTTLKDAVKLWKNHDFDFMWSEVELKLLEGELLQ